MTYLPTIISSHSVASFLYFAHKSQVNSVEPLLNTDVSDDINAASMQASSKPARKGTLLLIIINGLLLTIGNGYNGETKFQDIFQAKRLH